MTCQRTVLRTSPRFCRAHAFIYARALAGALTWSLGVIVLLWFAGGATVDRWPLLTTLLVLSAFIAPILAIVLKREAGVHLNLPPLAWRLHARRSSSPWNDTVVTGSYDPALGQNVYRRQFRCPVCKELGELPHPRTLYRCGEVEYEYRTGWLEDELWIANHDWQPAAPEASPCTGRSTDRTRQAGAHAPKPQSVSLPEPEGRSAGGLESWQAVSLTHAAFAPSTHIEGSGPSASEFGGGGNFGGAGASGGWGSDSADNSGSDSSGADSD